MQAINCIINLRFWHWLNYRPKKWSEPKWADLTWLLHCYCIRRLHCMEHVLDLKALLRIRCRGPINIFCCAAFSLSFLHLVLNIFHHDWCSFIIFCSINSCNIFFHQILVKSNKGVVITMMSMYILVQVGIIIIFE